MLSTTSILAALLLMLVVLGIVLTQDFFFRRDVYNRSDPLSFALFGYSFLLVLSDTGLFILRLITGKPFNRGFLIAAVVYLGVVFGVFQFSKFAHKGFKAAQDKTIRDYLAQLRDASTTSDKVWRALEELGIDTIEPDAFVKNPAKERQRIEYLTLVKQLTNADIEPKTDQEKLLVRESRIKRLAQFGYIVAFGFGLLSTLIFFYMRVNESNFEGTTPEENKPSITRQFFPDAHSRSGENVV